jgi:uroporphyrinogen-III synthase
MMNHIFYKSSLNSSLNSSLYLIESLLIMLHQQQVIVTRAQHQQDSFCQALTQQGAICIQAPCITLVDPPTSGHPLFIKDHYISRENLLSTPQEDPYTLVIFTSTNAVHTFMKIPKAVRNNILQEAKIAVVGQSTANALYYQGITCDYIPNRFVAESLLQTLYPHIIPTQTRVLIPRALKARTLIENRLLEWGARVHVCPLYQTIAHQLNSEIKRQIIAPLPVYIKKRWLTFTASSTVHHFVSQWSFEELKDLQARTHTAVIGPTVAQTAIEYGFAITAQAKPHTMTGLLSCLS